MSEQKIQPNDYMNELNQKALTSDKPEDLVLWVLQMIPSIIQSEIAVLSLLRQNVAMLSVGTNKTKDAVVDEVLIAVEDRLKEEIENKFVLIESRRIEIDAFGEITDEKASLECLYHKSLVSDGQLIGFVSIGSKKKNAFIKFKLNLLDAFCDQLALGLKSLINKNLIKEHAKTIALEKQKTDVIVSGMHEGLVLTDHDGKVITVNQAALHILGFVGNDGKKTLGYEAVVDKLFDKFDKHKPQKRDIVLSHPERRVVNVSTTPIFGEEKVFLGNSIVLTDVTKEREIEQMKSDFVNSVSHELKTPLSSIREAIALMVDEIVGEVNEKQKKCLSVAIKNTDRLTRLIDEMLDLSRIEAGKVYMKRNAEQVAPIIDHIIDSFQAKTQKADVLLIANVEDGLPPFFADVDRVIQIIINLVGNALKFTPSGGSITISAKYVSSHVDESMTDKRSNKHRRNFIEFSVSDTGPGITSDDMDKLFKRFSKLKSSEARNVKGTGLGLVISKEIVEKHGGRIWVESIFGKGSSFKFTIPVYAKECEYINFVQQEIERVKEIDSSLMIAKITFGASNKMKEFKGEIKSMMKRKTDIVLEYNASLLVLAESTQEGAEVILARMSEKLKKEITYKYILFPRDGGEPDTLFYALFD